MAIRTDIEGWLVRTILEMQEGLTESQVTPSASLFHDLGFDSLALERLAAEIDVALKVSDLALWYARALSHGEDTLGSLVDFLAAETVPGPARGEVIA
jgi:acyl carrier protein